MSKIVTKVLDSYGTKNSSTEQAWDYIQRTVGGARGEPNGGILNWSSMGLEHTDI
jgi:hypothetical protein